ncbi:class C sortase [Faecalimonas umbilicata]|uniref:class C sortase n=1 Tax=Faecalimonas umbilicata TaxID=1912855 RepID=UPI002A825F06|nr:class C sortase [Faecalimonas umbilicata]MDY4596794.1 class C sortase [Faecalimonas umbilicata]
MRKKNVQKKKFYIGDIFRIIVLLIAFSVLLYPTVSNYLYEKNGARVISSYDENAVRLSESEKQAMLEAARQYNRELLGNIELLDPFSPLKKEVDARYQSLLNTNEAGMMGYIRIPKIDVELPIYHGTEERILQSGVGHFEGTSLPVGGESSHTVLTGHRGLPSKLLFTDLDQMKEGDIFYLKILGETFAYKIDQILTVLPENTKALTIEPGKDYATLVTCTPYAVNTHRLLVRGSRIPYEEAVRQVPDEKITPTLPFQVKVLLAAIGVLVLIFIVYQLWKKTRKRKEMRRKRK